MYINRSIEKIIKEYIGSKEYLAIIGSRQVGKTTLIKKLVGEFENSYYYNFEDFSIKNEFENNPIGFVKNHVDKDKKNILFFDEFQYAENAGSLLKLVYDTFDDKVKVIITGSSSLHLKEIGAKMTGRIFCFEMSGLTIEEILLYRNKAFYKSRNTICEKFDITDLKIKDKDFLDLNKISFIQQIKDITDEYIIWGGLPEIIKSESINKKNTVISNFTQNYINKDILNLLKVRNIGKFTNLMTTMSILIGQQLVIENLSNDLGINIVTINSYLDYLSNTFINKLISPYYKNSLNEIKKQKIQYFYDIGIRNYLIRNFNKLDIRDDVGHLIENHIFLRLERIKDKFISLHYWREKSGNEVDFVIKMDDKLIPLEVKFKGLKKRKLTSGMTKFVDLYYDEIAYCFVITKNFLDIMKYKNKKVYFMPYYMF